MNSAIPEPVTKLTEAFSRLPGIGPKTASRLTYYLLRAPDDYSLSLASALTNLKTQTRYAASATTSRSMIPARSAAPAIAPQR